MPARTRLIVVPIIVDDENRILLCRMAPDRGVFPGQWALPGGGVEPGEPIEAALHREIAEELGITVASVEPLLFKDAFLEKTHGDGTRTPLHMVFLVYRCRPATKRIQLNEEFSEYAWVDSATLPSLSLNPLTIDTLTAAGLWPEAAETAR